jgi:hypothetical protein
MPTLPRRFDALPERLLFEKQTRMFRKLIREAAISIMSILP